MALDNKSHDLSSIFRTHMIERSDSYYLLSDLHKGTHQTHKLFLKLILIKSHLPPNKTFCSHCVSLCVVCCVHLRLCLCVYMQRPEQLCFILWDRVSHLTRGSVSVRLVGQWTFGTCLSLTLQFWCCRCALPCLAVDTSAGDSISGLCA